MENHLIPELSARPIFSSVQELTPHSVLYRQKVKLSLCSSPCSSSHLSLSHTSHTLRVCLAAVMGAQQGHITYLAV